MEYPEEKVARAYVYSGEWVADCPRADCGNVEFLYRPAQLHGERVLRLPFFGCSYCGMQSEISWPDKEHEIFEVLAKRPVPGSRNWYPKDHPVAVASRIPHGQSVQDLEDENAQHGVI